MKSTLMTTSAVVFYNAGDHEPIPMSWFNQAIDVFREYTLDSILFTAGGGDFELDDCCLLSDQGSEIHMWGDQQPIVPRLASQLDNLRRGAVYSLTLDCPQPGGHDREEWRAKVSASSIGKRCFMGVEEQLCSDPGAVLRRAYAISKDFFDIRYGFAYKMPLAELPDCYASGSRRFSFADFQEWMRLRTQGIQRPPTADDLWKDELTGAQRHLSGLFRAAYPVNLLSTAHLQTGGIRTCSLGQLSNVGDGVWLWELSQTEIPQAQAMLQSRGVLVSQAARA